MPGPPARAPGRHGDPVRRTLRLRLLTAGAAPLSAQSLRPAAGPAAPLRRPNLPSWTVGPPGPPGGGARGRSRPDSSPRRPQWPQPQPQPSAAAHCGSPIRPAGPGGRRTPAGTVQRLNRRVTVPGRCASAAAGPGKPPDRTRRAGQCAVGLKAWRGARTQAGRLRGSEGSA